MEGDSISGKVRTAIMSHELDREAQVAALKRQIAILDEELLRYENAIPRTRRTMQ